jgi:alkylation response protein AidB-like acyl-CoA dehydrogenase
MLVLSVAYFQLMSAGVSLGLMDAATEKSARHVSNTKLQHLGQSLAELPTIRAYLSRMRIKTDMVRAFLLDALDAVEQQREDALLRVLQVKAAAGEAPTTDALYDFIGKALCGLPLFP